MLSLAYLKSSLLNIIADSGSRYEASNPQDTRTSSGWKRSSAGATTRSNVALYAPEPDPGGKGTLMV